MPSPTAEPAARWAGLHPITVLAPSHPWRRYIGRAGDLDRAVRHDLARVAGPGARSLDLALCDAAGRLVATRSSGPPTPRRLATPDEAGMLINPIARTVLLDEETGMLPGEEWSGEIVVTVGAPLWLVWSAMSTPNGPCAVVGVLGLPGVPHLARLLSRAPLGASLTLMPGLHHSLGRAVSEAVDDLVASRRPTLVEDDYRMWWTL